VFGNQQNGMRNLFTYIFFTLSFFVFAQTKPNPPKKQEPKKFKTINVLNADTLTFDKVKSDAQILIGNVKCEHEGALLYCDSALLYSSKRLRASGHIKIVKGDSITVTGDKLLYDASTKLATLEGNVVCIEKDMTLTTNLLTFDLANSIANYYNGGTIVNKENTLKSKNGHYYSSSKDVAFNYDVVLTNPDYKMNSDTLRYNTISKTAYFLGPSIILSKDDYIYCENGYYDTQNERSAFSKNALLVTKQQKLRGDSLFYDRNKQLGKAFKNVTLVDTSQKSILYGDYIEYKEKKSEAFVTKKAIYARVVEQDTLFIHADTLYHRDVDSVNNFLNAYHNVRLYKKDMQAICDSASYSSMDSLMQLYYEPILWSNRSQATGKKIKIKINNQNIKGFILENNAFLVNQVDSSERFNQLSCKNIEAFFERDTIRKAILTDNVEALYYAKEKDKVIGLNKTTSPFMNIWFKNEDIDRSTMSGRSVGSITPIKDVSEAEAKLKGYSWQYERRPTSKQDLLRETKKNEKKRSRK
jgi:lipopolysaccharide export system protein LptA